MARGSLYDAPKRPVFGAPIVSKTMSAPTANPAICFTRARFGEN